MSFSLIVACDEEMGIGKDNKIPWFIPGELGWVAKKTKASSEGKINALIMGKNTWLSLPESKRPLADRVNIVVSSTLTIENDSVLVFNTFEEAVDYVKKNKSEIENTFFFGGTSIYKAALAHEYLDELLIAKVPGKHDADVFFPKIPENFKKTTKESFFYGDTKVIREVWKK